jgi:hypothetical protein
LALLLLACGGGAPPSAGTASREPPASAGDEASLIASEEAHIKALRQRLQGAIDAFRSRNAAALRTWVEHPDQSAALRTFGAGLLVRLRAEHAEELFVASFSEIDGDQIGVLDEIEYALSDADSDVAYPVQATLICGALRRWPGALDALVAIRAYTDGSLHMDNCCGLTLYAAEHPDDAIARFADASLQPEVLHAFTEEASPADAARVLATLEARTYAVPAQEQLRTALLPILRSKATADGPTACDWLKCEEILSTGPVAESPVR